MLRVLTYHRVAEPRNGNYLNPRMISATPAAFEEQIRHLVKHYRVVSVREVLAAVEKSVQLPGHTTMLTFDDAYRDFGEVAWPILRRYRLPVTLFVPTGYPDHPTRSFWWDRLYRAFAGTNLTRLDGTPLGTLLLNTQDDRRVSLRKAQDYVKAIPHAESMAFVDRICDQLGGGSSGPAGVLSWDELRALARESVTLGAHTQSHPILTRLPLEQAREEIRGSQEDLRREIGDVLPIFCYPGGAHNDAVVAIVKEEGFKMAFATLDGQNRLGTADLLRLRRTNITPRTSLPIFRLRLTRAVSYLDAWRHREKHPRPEE